MLVRHADTITAAIAAAEAELAAARDEIVGTLRVAAFPTAARSMMPQVLATLGGRHPKLRLMLRDLESNESLLALQVDEIDLAVVDEYDEASRFRAPGIQTVDEEWVTSSPRWIGRVQVLLAKTPFLRMIFGRISRQTQQQKYPGDFVVQFVPGDGRNFDFGLDFTGCAIHKFFQAEQAGHFAKYMCRIDYLTTSFKGIELIRTSTIANGAERCDFRYRLAGRSPQPAVLPSMDRGV